MRKIGIFTLNGNYNFGNRLQSYALMSILRKYSYEPENIWITTPEKFKKHTTKRVPAESVADKKFNMFCDFTDKHLKSKHLENVPQINPDDYEYFFVGSDQVWNSTYPSFDPDQMLLNFSKDTQKNIAYAASISVAEIPEEHKEIFKSGINNFKAISVREEKGQELLNELDASQSIQVVLDPTLVLSSNEWDEIVNKPDGLNEDTKYILTCFLGEFADEHRKEVNELARENNWKVINLMDENDPFFCSGPKEFLYLEKHAEVVFTDSFHSCVFALIYNRPFVIYDRVTEGMCPMNSRMDTLINTFKLKDRFHEGTLTENNLKYDFSEANEILKNKQTEAIKFIEKALDLK